MTALYRLMFYTPLVVLVVIFAGLAMGVVADATESPWWWNVTCLGAVAWSAYQLLFRIPHRLTLEAGILSASAPLRYRSVPVEDVVELRPSLLGSNFEVIELIEGRAISVLVGTGFSEFANALAGSNKELPVRIGLQGRLWGRVPGMTRFVEE
jgi:hypothetical protein